MTERQLCAKRRSLVRHLYKATELLVDLLSDDTERPSRGADDSRRILIRDMREYANWLDRIVEKQVNRNASVLNGT